MSFDERELTQNSTWSLVGEKKMPPAGRTNGKLDFPVLKEERAARFVALVEEQLSRLQSARTDYTSHHVVVLGGEPGEEGMAGGHVLHGDHSTSTERRRVRPARPSTISTAYSGTSTQSRMFRVNGSEATSTESTAFGEPHICHSPSTWL